MEMADQVIVVRLKITMCAMEGLQLQLINVNNELQDTIQIVVRTTERIDVVMGLKYQKNNVMIVTLIQVMVEIQFAQLNPVMFVVEGMLMMLMISEHIAIIVRGCIKVM